MSDNNLMPETLAAVIPTHGYLEYARQAVESFFHTKPPGVPAIVVVADDASPAWNEDSLHGDRAADETLATMHSRDHIGVTAAMNAGLSVVHQTLVKPDLVVLANSDVIFTRDWWRPVWEALSGGWDLVGPATNAPGPTSKGVQDVTHYVRDYQPSDAPEDLADAANALHRACDGRVEPCQVNGFCLCAAYETWRRFAFELPAHTFPPQILVMPSGRSNPDPKNLGQETWLAHEISKGGGKVGCALGSFVFHFRSISRGLGHASPGWYRRPE